MLVEHLAEDRVCGMRAMADLLERGGDFTRELDVVTALGVDAENAAVEADEEGGLRVRISLPPSDADRIAAKLTAEGWGAEHDKDDAALSVGAP